MSTYGPCRWRSSGSARLTDDTFLQSAVTKILGGSSCQAEWQFYISASKIRFILKRSSGSPCNLVGQNSRPLKHRLLIVDVSFVIRESSPQKRVCTAPGKACLGCESYMIVRVVLIGGGDNPRHRLKNLIGVLRL